MERFAEYVHAFICWDKCSQRAEWAGRSCFKLSIALIIIINCVMKLYRNVLRNRVIEVGSFPRFCLKNFFSRKIEVTLYEYLRTLFKNCSIVLSIFLFHTNDCICIDYLNTYFPVCIFLFLSDTYTYSFHTLTHIHTLTMTLEKSPCLAILPFLSRNKGLGTLSHELHEYISLLSCCMNQTILCTYFLC